MTYKNERRHNDRIDTTAFIVYFPFSSFPTDKCEAEVINSNADGMCFQSQRPLKPGQGICIRKKQVVNAETRLTDVSVIRDLSIATVQWCEKKEDLSQIRYCIGVKYL